MSISNELRWQQNTLTGAAQAIPVTFVFFLSSELQVIRTRDDVDTILAITTDYTVTGGGTPAATGTVTMVAGLADDVITITGAAPETQLNTLTSSGPLPSLTLTAMYDRLTILIQQLRVRLDRSLQLPLSAELQNPFPLASRASTVLGFDTSGNFALLPSAGYGAAGMLSRLDLITFIGGTSTSLDSLAADLLEEGTIILIQPGGLGNPIVTVQVVIAADAPSAGAITRSSDYATSGKAFFTVG